MFKTYVKIFTGNWEHSVENQANNWAGEHSAEIVSASYAVNDSHCFHSLTVVYKEKK